MRHAAFLLPLVMVMITGCGSGGGGGGGGDSAAGPGTVTPPSTTKAMGERQMPGSLVSVERLAPLVAGSTCAFRLTITGSTVTAVSARIGRGYGEGDTVVATPIAGQIGRYDVALPIPASGLSDLRVWASITLADGSEVESGLEDFSLN